MSNKNNWKTRIFNDTSSDSPKPGWSWKEFVWWKNGSRLENDIFVKWEPLRKNGSRTGHVGITVRRTYTIFDNIFNILFFVRFRSVSNRFRGFRPVLRNRWRCLSWPSFTTDVPAPVDQGQIVIRQNSSTENVHGKR